MEEKFEHVSPCKEEKTIFQRTKIKKHAKSICWCVCSYCEGKAI